MHNIYIPENFKNSAFISYNFGNKIPSFTFKFEQKKFNPQILFDNIEEDKVETSNSNKVMIIEKEEKENKLLNENQITNKPKYIKKNKKTRFRVANMNFAKSGNYITKNSKRHQNCKNKIIRNFIQDVLIYWINDGVKNNILKKINPSNIPYNYLEKKNLKLKDIYKENIELNVPNKDLSENTSIKLNFSFKQALISFCDEKSRNKILSEVKNEIGKVEDNIYDKLKTKNDYIKEKQLDLRDKAIFEDCFRDIVQSLN